MKKAILFALIVFLLKVHFAYTASSPLQPQRGGNMKMITNEFPVDSGHPKIARGGMAPLFGCLEQLISFDSRGNITPHLALSWDADPVN